MSGTMTSTPSVVASGNIIPQSTTMAASPYSYTIRFIPISPSPPSGMMRRGSGIDGAMYHAPRHIGNAIGEGRRQGGRTPTNIPDDARPGHRHGVQQVAMHARH